MNFGCKEELICSPTQFQRIPRDRHKQRGLLRMSLCEKGKCLLLQLHIWQVTSVVVFSRNVRGFQSDLCLLFKRDDTVPFRHLSLVLRSPPTSQITHKRHIHRRSYIEYECWSQLTFFILAKLFSVFICKARTSCTLLKINSFSCWNERPIQNLGKKGSF